MRGARSGPRRAEKKLRQDLHLVHEERLALVEAAQQILGHASLNETMRALIDAGLEEKLSRELREQIVAQLRAKKETQPAR